MIEASDEAATKQRKPKKENEVEKTPTTEEPKKSPPEPEPIPQSAADGKPSSSGSAGAEGIAGSAGSSSGDGRRGRKAAVGTQISKPTVPDIYPQVMAIPIAKRPLFPGFYKAITIRDPQVVSAIQEMIKRGQPYVGAFLFKDESADKDVIEKMDDVHEVGVFAQITSVFPIQGDEAALTAVLYPHRRIKMTALRPPTGETQSVDQSSEQTPAASIVEVTTLTEEKTKPDAENATPEGKGDVVASFEEAGKDSPAQLAIYEPTQFLRKHAVSLVNVENLTETNNDKKSDKTKALTAEIVSVFKDVARLNPLFRDQVSDFSVSQSAGNVIEEPAKLADFAAAVSAGDVEEMQDVLQTMDVEERLHKALVLLKKEFMNAELQTRISKDVESKIQKRQRE